ncbi:MAG: DUF362 domain-containing protein [Prevotellaceae bacterium]|jgi:uncharacterized protein (DUF362 family)|nr:DUF362 domain-containing protein [Prevotellaceae bacterium]
MKRRDFLKNAALAGVASMLSFDSWGKAVASGSVAVEQAPDLVAVMGGEPDEMLKKALEALGGIGNFVKKGQTIAIKPNIGWDKSPELAANTNPVLIGALVKMCYNAGAKEVQVFDHTCNTWNSCYTNSGIEKAVKAAGGKMLPAHEETYYKDVNLPQGIRLKSAKIHEAIIGCDAWINVPVLKNHGGAKLTCAMKNYMGIVWDRRYFHSNDLAQCIADSCTYSKKPALNIVDAYRVMKTNGPQGKSLNDIATLKTLIASTDIVAVDTAALKFFNQVVTLPMSEVGYLSGGQKHKLGTTDIDKLNIKRIKM